MRKESRIAILATYLLAAGVAKMLVVSNNLLAGGLSDLSRYVMTKPQRLFSLKYGEGSSQVGMFIPHPKAEDSGEPSGPSDFTIGYDGSIYIGDEQNGKVKKFDRYGKILMMTEGEIDRIAGMAVDNRGRIYVIHGTLSNEVAVYDGNGKRLPELEKKIMEVMEKLAKEMASTQPKLKEEIFGGFNRFPAGEVRCDRSGNLYFRGGQFIVKVDSLFTQAQLVNRYPYPLNGKGFYYAYRLLPSQRKAECLTYGTDGSLLNRFPMPILRRVEVTIYNADGSVVRRFTLPRGEWSKIEELVPMGGGDIICDGRGHFYTLRDPGVLYHLPLKPDHPRFFVVYPFAVLEYDSEGNFVGVRAIISGFTMFSNWFEVDLQGNVYWLDYKADHLDVMMAPVPQK